MRQKGYGQLSSIDLLPEWAEEARLWAFDALKDRRLTQEEILEGFNERIKVAAWEIGITDPPRISRSAFNRKALRLSILGRRLQETREIAAVLAPKLDQAGDNSVTLMVSETIKVLIGEMLENAGALSANGDTAEMLMMTARALVAAEQAKRISSETRQKIEAELKSKTAKAVDAVAAAKGLSADTVSDIKARILGVDRKGSSA
jgi:hypothetical protein